MNLTKFVIDASKLLVHEAPGPLIQRLVNNEITSSKSDEHDYSMQPVVSKTPFEESESNENQRGAIFREVEDMVSGLSFGSLSQPIKQSTSQ